MDVGKKWKAAAAVINVGSWGLGGVSGEQVKSIWLRMREQTNKAKQAIGLNDRQPMPLMSAVEKRVADITGKQIGAPITGKSSFEPIDYQIQRQCSFLKKNIPGDLDGLLHKLDQVLLNGGDDYEEELRNFLGQSDEQGALRGFSAAFKAGGKLAHPDFRKALKKGPLRTALSELRKFSERHADGFVKCGGIGTYIRKNGGAFRFESGAELDEYKAYIREGVEKMQAVADAYDNDPLSAYVLPAI
jgi:hypothetical protein